MKSLTVVPLLAGLLVGNAQAQFQINGVTFENQRQFIALGLRCATVMPTPMQMSQDRERIATFRVSNAGLLPRPARSYMIEIPVYFHVIQNSNGDGNLSDQKLDEQLKVLNDCFGKSMFHFTTARIDRTKNPKWYRMKRGSPEEAEAKKALGRDQDTHLNVYTAGLQGGVLGWATFPVDFASKATMDGVVIVNTSVPGGSGAPYNQGKTAVHEVGHWLGVYHTFQNRCVPPGDEIDDTPAQDSPTDGCPQDQDTCPENGKDPVTNYMDYSDDTCLNQFTNGQNQRMDLQVGTYRSGLLPNNVKAVIKSVPVR